MRTTVDLPDGLYRQIKARAALEGLPVKALVGRLLQRGMAAVDEPAAGRHRRSEPPVVEVDTRFPLARPTNAALFELLDEPQATRR